MNYRLRKNAIPLLWAAGGFFAARCTLFGRVCPIGCAYLSLMLGRGTLWLGALTSALGVITQRKEVYISGYLIAFALLSAANGVIRYFRFRIRGRYELSVGALLSGLAMTAGGLIAALPEKSLYYGILAVLQGMLTALLALLFQRGTEVFKSEKGDERELLGLALLIGCVCAGMEDISLLGIPLSLIALAAVLPYFMAKGRGNNGAALRQRLCGRLEGYALSLDRLAYSLSNVTDKADKERDMESLRRSLKKCRSLLSGELKGVTLLLRSLAQELREELRLGCDTEKSAKIKRALRERGMRCNEVLVYGRGENRYEVSLIRRCNGNCGRCLKTAASVVGSCLGARVERGLDMCSFDGERHILKLCSEKPYRISAYAMGRIRDGSGVSGDSHSFMELKYGKYMLALSDGMGSGGRAKEESAASVELFEDFVEAGFERDMVLEQINSLLLMQSGGEDIFATLDICNVDLYEGKAEFVKIGGMPSFIAGSGSGVRLIGGGGLPIGIMERAEAEETEVKLNDGDVIVMVTDGVTEAFCKGAGKENRLAELIDKNRELPAERLCAKILEAAEKADNGQIRDDMTVMAAKVWRV